LRAWFSGCQSDQRTPHRPCFGASSCRSRRGGPAMPRQEIIIKDTHRGIWYEDGVLVKVVGAGRYEVPSPWGLFKRRPRVEAVLNDIRHTDPTTPGPEVPPRPHSA